ncbi:hypothetical protein [Sedimentitalea arenosa]|jgi:hypothetical protein|uniref:DUF1795 domain-containing protein n=1 Tax=Sedimentitalea arenosa TaxID=2798803 RepID=A0A8J7J2T8_9RHOB|nr:hypothetical protein [Arenibacterium arenosum]MBJ6370700.1 hypothetical protein [Arenibacterium arenosum]
MPHSRLSLKSALATAALLLAPVAQADTPLTYTDNGKALFSLSVPDFWTVHVGGPRDLADPETGESRFVSRVIGLQPQTDPRLWVGLVSPFGVRDFAGVQKYLSEIGPFLVKDAVVEDLTRKTIAGRDARTLTGKGRRDGKTVHFTAVAIDLPANRMAVAVVVMEAGLDQASLADVNRMFASFRAGR